MSAPLSPFFQSGNLIFISGQVGSNPDDGAIPDDFDRQAANVFVNLDIQLNSAGLSKVDIVKTTVYMTDLSQFDLMNQLYAEYFGEHKPARTTVGVAALPEFPGDPTVHIEIDAIAAHQQNDRD